MRGYIVLGAFAVALVQSAGAVSSQSGRPSYTEAYEAWDRGDYVVALERLKALVPAADE